MGGSLENSFTAHGDPEEGEEGEEEDEGMEMGCWKKQVELNRISPSEEDEEREQENDHAPSSPLSQSYTPYDFDTSSPSPLSPLSRVESAYGFNDTPTTTTTTTTMATNTPPSPPSQVRTPYDFDYFKFPAPPNHDRGVRAAVERRWSGSTAHEEVLTPSSEESMSRRESGGSAVSGSSGSLSDRGGMREMRALGGLGFGVGALGALLDGVVEERVFFRIEDFPKPSGGLGGAENGEGVRRGVGMAR
ncbi:hypothetical protein V490_01329 [Pseudogymnoascus sp. VKM F-3557]|nr:hypothetical protein V490_01329 [Pseudogymnoascus sp. VKM F-3557]